MKVTRIIYPEKIPSGTSQQRKIAVINGKRMSYPTKTLKETKRIYADALRRAERPPEAFRGACKISVSFEYGTSDKRKLKGKYKITKPDLDNMVKTFVDSLVNFGYLTDDSIIVNLSASKSWSDKTRILFILEEVEPRDAKSSLNGIARRPNRDWIVHSTFLVEHMRRGEVCRSTWQRP